MKLRDLFLRLRAVVVPRRVEGELDEELAFHIEREAHKRIAEGSSRADALAMARARFGSVPLAADQCRDARGTAAIDTTKRDVLYAVRSLRRAPLAAVSIVATIALGLALITVAFTIYNAIFLRVDAVRNPDELFAVERLTRPDLPHRPGSDRAWTPFTQREFNLLRHDTGVLADAVALLPGVATRIDGRAMDTTLVSGNFFQVLGANATLGRTLGPADDDRASGHQVLVLSHKGWNKIFAGDRSAMGRAVRVNGLPCEVVGVMPQDFRGLGVVPPDFWGPLALAAELRPGAASGDDLVVTSVVGRLLPGIPPEKAEAGLTAWASGRSDLQRNSPFGPNQITLTPSRGTLWPESFKGLISAIFFALGLVLMIGCANVANMLLARGLSRQREIGVRLSLGASRGRIVRQLFTESLVLALAAAACGVVLSQWLLASAVYAVSTAMPPEMTEHLNIAALPVDWRVMLFLVCVAMVSTVLFGLAPAVRATRVELVRAMKGEVTKEARPGRARQTLVALQVCAAALLLISSTVFLRSAFKAATIDFGFRTSDTLLVPVTHEPLRATMLDQIATHPSVVAVAASWPGLAGFPTLVRAQTLHQALDGGPAVRSVETRAATPIGYDFASPEYFTAIGIDVLKGRGFAQDERTADAGVAVVSEQGARRLWPNDNAVGQLVQFAASPPKDLNQPDAASPPSRTYAVVGVVRDAGATFGDGSSQFSNPDVYLPIGLESSGTSLVVRVHGDPDEARRALLDRLLTLDPALGEIKTFRAMARARAFLLWAAFWVTAVVAGLALTLTTSGLFSVLSYTVEQRKKEIGVRMALGATRRDVAGWVLTQTFRPVVFGLVAGTGLVTVLVKVLMRWTPFLLSGIVRVFDPVTYTFSAGVIVAACLLAASLPAWRAARTDPIETLRND